jgi:hypothetical protein
MASEGQHINLIRELERIESARIVSYILADRLQGPQASIAMDALGLFHRHLEAIGKVRKIALFLYSIGGDTMVPWPLVNLIREYCDQFTVLVPHKAHSAATLVCLGADEIVMTKMAQLSPVDPSVANAFNPEVPGKEPKERIPISVEDVAAYFRLATERAGLDTAEAKLGALQQLTNVVHPLALGNVERSHSQIRDLSRKLLGLHMTSETEDEREKIDAIVDVLTEKLYSHQHLIPRREAKNIIGLKVRYATDEEEDKIMGLYGVYAKELGVGSILNPVVMLQDRTELPLELTIAKIETVSTEDKFTMKGKIVRATKPGQSPAVNIVEQGWQATR